jgi:hypothetical protein
MKKKKKRNYPGMIKVLLQVGLTAWSAVCVATWVLWIFCNFVAFANLVHSICE